MSLVPLNSYGVTILLYSSSNYVISTSIVNKCAQMGLSFIRLQVPWFAIDHPGGYNWSYTDAAIQTINSYGLNVLFDINSPPSTRTGVLAPDGNYVTDPASARQFAVDVVTRYYLNGATNGYIFGIDFNEDMDNKSPFNTSANNGGYAADVMNSVYPAVKAIAPSCLVVGYAHLSANRAHLQQWHTQLYTGGGVSGSGGMGQNSDFVNWHYYPGNLKDPTNSGASAEYAEFLSDIQGIDEANGFFKGSWNTEIGWPATLNGNSNNVSYAQQSQYLVADCEETARFSDYVHKFCFYTASLGDNFSLVQAGPPIFYTPAGLALQAQIALTPDWSPPPLDIKKRFGTISIGGNSYGTVYVNDL
jgi:hypothetical protein